MSQTIQTSAICEFMSRHLVDVFDTMLSMKAVPWPAPPLPAFAEAASPARRLWRRNGHRRRLSAPLRPLCQACRRRHAGHPTGGGHFGESEVNDVVGEATNMLTGGLKSWLCDSGAPCAVSTPAIIRGTAFSIEPCPMSSANGWSFECGDEFAFMVEIHIKVG
jgi:hypothetical protein